MNSILDDQKIVKFSDVVKLLNTQLSILFIVFEDMTEEKVLETLVETID